MIARRTCSALRAGLLSVACGLGLSLGLSGTAAAGSGHSPTPEKPHSGAPAYSILPTDGDPLQHVRWFVFGANAPAGRAADQYRTSNPAWAKAIDVIADTPGSLNYRFNFWNTTPDTIAHYVHKVLSTYEREQPGTTVPLSTFSLVHGPCQDPASIAGRYEQWVDQLAAGIGNYRAVLYLEQDSLLQTHCLTPNQLAVREQELTYAVKALARDPNVLVYLDAGAADGRETAKQMAALLRASDVSQAAGFVVNSTHDDWTTSSIYYGQQIAAMVGGKHFIVNTSSNGRGPLLNPHPKTQGIEDLCNPPGRGLGPITVDTGYKYLDALLWANNPGNSVGDCGAGDPAAGTFWPQYAVDLVQNRVDTVTGPHEPLIKSSTDT